MARLVWACEHCWAGLLQQGARLHNAGPSPVRHCDCCRSGARPGQRMMCFLVAGEVKTPARA
jgi:hypothetical protein